jgi:hypothetical protein
MVTTEILVYPANGIDIDDGDHIIETNILVERIMLPESNGFNSGSRTGILLGSTMFEEVTITNAGNAYDPNVRVKHLGLNTTFSASRGGFHNQPIYRTKCTNRYGNKTNLTNSRWFIGNSY